MQPPSGSPHIFIGTDKDGNPWLLAWGLPGAPDVWSAMGLDNRRYPCVKTLDEWNGIVSFARHHNGKFKTISSSVAKRRYRKLVESAV